MADIPHRSRSETQEAFALKVDTANVVHTLHKIGIKKTPNDEEIEEWVAAKGAPSLLTYREEDRISFVWYDGSDTTFLNISKRNDKPTFEIKIEYDSKDENGKYKRDSVVAQDETLEEVSYDSRQKALLFKGENQTFTATPKV